MRAIFTYPLNLSGSVIVHFLQWGVSTLRVEVKTPLILHEASISEVFVVFNELRSQIAVERVQLK